MGIERVVITSYDPKNSGLVSISEYKRKTKKIMYKK